MLLIVYIFYVNTCLIVFFFFSSRRRHTRSLRDWSSDVCSSDLDRAVDELERAAPRDRIVLEDFRPGDVGGHEIGGELDSTELEIQDLREGGDEEGLREPGDAHEEAMPVGDEHREELLDDLVLAHDHLAQLTQNGVAPLLQVLQEPEIV